MGKYDVRFCKCGTIHFLLNETFEQWCSTKNGTSGKEIVQVCLNCGATLIRGFDNYDEGLAYYSRDLRDTMEINDSDKYKVILSKGVRLRMESGDFADTEIDSVYMNYEALQKEIGGNMYRIKGYGMGEAATIPFRDVKSINVDMKALLRDITEEQAESMCGYYIKSFNWKGTPYESAANCW